MFLSDLKGIRKMTETTKEWYKLKMFKKLRLKVTSQKKNMKRVDRTQEEIRKKTQIFLKWKSGTQEWKYIKVNKEEIGEKWSQRRLKQIEKKLSREGIKKLGKEDQTYI